MNNIRTGSFCGFRRNCKPRTGEIEKPGVPQVPLKDTGLRWTSTRPRGSSVSVNVFRSGSSGGMRLNRCRNRQYPPKELPARLYNQKISELDP